MLYKIYLSFINQVLYCGKEKIHSEINLIVY